MNDESPRRESYVAVAGVFLVLGHIGFRAWALLPSWFYLDDYKLLSEASGSRLELGYLFEQYNSHLMPGGKALAWLVAQSGTLNWTVAALLMLGLQSLAAISALWALLTVFRRRWVTLVPLILYLTSSMTVPAMMWWTAGVNQVPLQAALFVAVGSFVQYLRGRRFVWLLTTVTAVICGLFFYVKALLILPVLAFIALGWFASGGPLSRVRHVCTRYPVAAVAGISLGLAYTAYYVTHVSSPFTPVTLALVGEVAETLLGTAFVAGAIGGPWAWRATAPPNAFADPPGPMVHVAWALIAIVILAGWLQRTRTLRAWVLLAGYLVGCLALLVTSRGVNFGGIIGLEYRYLTDAGAILALCIGLAFIEVPGAVEPSRPRVPAGINRGVPLPLVGALVTAIAIGGIVSSARYILIWHNRNPSVSYMKTLTRDVAQHGHVDVADRQVPGTVIPSMFAPDNRLSLFAPLLSGRMRFPDQSHNLATVGNDGTLRRVLIGPGVTSRPGPDEDCGWKVTHRGRTIPLTARAFENVWWLRIGYLYSTDSPVRITAGDGTMHTRLQPGVNSLYIRVEGTFDEVRIEGIEASTVMCVDTIEVGPPEAGQPLE